MGSIWISPSKLLGQILKGPWPLQQYMGGKGNKHDNCVNHELPDWLTLDSGSRAKVRFIAAFLLHGKRSYMSLWPEWNSVLSFGESDASLRRRIHVCGLQSHLDSNPSESLKTPIFCNSGLCLGLVISASSLGDDKPQSHWSKPLKNWNWGKGLSALVRKQVDCV